MVIVEQGYSSFNFVVSFWRNEYTSSLMNAVNDLIVGSMSELCLMLNASRLLLKEFYVFCLQSKKECEYLINLAKPHMAKSTVVDSKTGKSKDSRLLSHLHHQVLL